MPTPELQRGGHAQQAARRSGGCAAHRRIVLAKQCAGAFGKVAAGIGGREPARGPLHETRADAILERRQRPCHRRGRAAQPAGRTRETARVDDRDEDGEFVETVHR
jgi:hypothetical protein